VSTFRDRVGDTLIVCQQCAIKTNVLIDDDGTLTAVLRTDQTQTPTLLVFRERLLLVTWLSPKMLGDDPDLQHAARSTQEHIGPNLIRFLSSDNFQKSLPHVRASRRTDGRKQD